MHVTHIEWENEFKRKDELPAIFLQDGEQLSLFLKPEQLNKFTLEELQAYLKEYERSQLVKTAINIGS